MSVKKLSFILIGGVIAIIAFYCIALIYFTWPINEFSINKSGVFGDSFGLLTSLFSGLAFAGLIITIVMQKDELALQREELELTRKELAGQKEELKIQNETMRLQKFESTFFQMLSLHNEIVKGIDIKVGSKEYTGRDAFEFLRRQLGRITERVHQLKSGDLDALNSSYMAFYNSPKIQNEVGHYFRNLYNILKFVDQSSVDEKRMYTNLLRAQLSSYELCLLFYNCLSEMGSDKFKPLIEEYSLLKTLPDELLFNSEVHKSFYADSAFTGT